MAVNVGSYDGSPGVVGLHRRALVRVVGEVPDAHLNQEVRHAVVSLGHHLYDRLLAYIVTPGQGDFGLRMIRAGNAAEYTYDSAYMKQAAYRAAEAKARAENRGLWGKCGGVDVPLVAPTPDPPTPSKKPPTGGGGCADGYSPCVPPYPPDVNCDDVDGPITVTGSDPHGLDADDDGIACES